MMSSIAKWRIDVLEKRAEALRSYINYRQNLHARLVGNGAAKDWLVKLALEIRRIVNRIFFGIWLKIIELRIRFWEDIAGEEIRGNNS